ncbi:hypothetical protein VUR80DRAFT_4543 [Thermomyces stellatus]
MTSRCVLEDMRVRLYWTGWPRPYFCKTAASATPKDGMCRGRLLRGRPMPPTWRERVTVSGEGKIDCEKGWERAGLWKHSGRVGDQDVRKEKKKTRAQEEQQINTNDGLQLVWRKHSGRRFAGRRWGSTAISTGPSGEPQGESRSIGCWQWAHKAWSGRQALREHHWREILTQAFGGRSLIASPVRRAYHMRREADATAPSLSAVSRRAKKRQGRKKLTTVAGCAADPGHRRARARRGQPFLNKPLAPSSATPVRIVCIARVCPGIPASSDCASPSPLETESSCKLPAKLA